MRITPIDLTTATEADRDAWCEVALICQRADLPEYPEPTRESLLNRLQPRASEQVLAWAARAGDRFLGTVMLILYAGENGHLALVVPQVHPAVRRRGVGRALVRVAVDLARQERRTTLVGDTRTGTAGDGFATAMGAQAVQEEVQSLLRLPAVDGAAMTRWAGGEEAETSGLTLVRWRDRVPEELMEAFLHAREGLDDMPIGGLDLRPERRSAQEMREIEASAQQRGVRVYVVAPYQTSTGRLAGYTSVYVEPGNPWASVGSTAVLPVYRGRGFGLWVKAAMVGWLQETEPQLSAYLTGNARSNVHMRRINERMGYRVLDTWRAWQLRL
jgi:GNAT superfamily N-acetyltransferase